MRDVSLEWTSATLRALAGAPRRAAVGHVGRSRRPRRFCPRRAGACGTSRGPRRPAPLHSPSVSPAPSGTGGDPEPSDRRRRATSGPPAFSARGGARGARPAGAPGPRCTRGRRSACGRGRRRRRPQGPRADRPASAPRRPRGPRTCRGGPASRARSHRTRRIGGIPGGDGRRTSFAAGPRTPSGGSRVGTTAGGRPGRAAPASAALAPCAPASAASAFAAPAPWRAPRAPRTPRRTPSPGGSPPAGGAR